MKKYQKQAENTLRGRRGEVKEEELEDLIEIGERIVSMEGGMGDIGRMQEIFLRSRFNQKQFMELMRVTKTELMNHADRTLGLKWKQLWTPDRWVHFGTFTRMRQVVQEQSVGDTDDLELSTM